MGRFFVHAGKRRGTTECGRHEINPGNQGRFEVGAVFARKKYQGLSSSFGPERTKGEALVEFHHMALGRKKGAEAYPKSSARKRLPESILCDTKKKTKGY